MTGPFPEAVSIATARVALKAVDQPAEIFDLTAGEREVALRLGDRRRRDYLLGRAALKQLLADSGGDATGSEVAMPHPCLSLTHGGGIAIAARSCAEPTVGVGVDWEPARAVDPAAARFFLTERESGAIDARSDDLLRLWTVKEALFKATPANGDLSLRMYETLDAAAELGEARLDGSGALVFRYGSWRVNSGFLSVALAFAASATVLSLSRSGNRQ
jgi:4'-phosphopantetheinyl transferase EntD